jgi:hypothetical protein
MGIGSFFFRAFIAFLVICGASSVSRAAGPSLGIPACTKAELSGELRDEQVRARPLSILESSTDLRDLQPAEVAGAAQALTQEALAKCSSPGCFKRLWSAQLARLKAAFDRTCISKNPAAIAATVEGLGLFWTSLGLVHSRNEDASVRNFPWEHVINSIIWTGVFNTVGCYEQLSPEERKPFQGTVLGRLHHRYGKVRTYQMLFPFGAATAVGLEATFDHALEGQLKDPATYAGKWAFYTTFDLTFSTFWRVAIIDPVFMQMFPGFEKVLRPLLKRELLLTPTMMSARLATRASLNTVSSWVFLKTGALVEDPSSLAGLKEVLLESDRLARKLAAASELNPMEPETKKEFVSPSPAATEAEPKPEAP